MRALFQRPPPEPDRPVSPLCRVLHKRESFTSGSEGAGRGSSSRLPDSLQGPMVVIALKAGGACGDWEGGDELPAKDGTACEAASSGSNGAKSKPSSRRNCRPIPSTASRRCGVVAGRRTASAGGCSPSRGNMRMSKRGGHPNDSNSRQCSAARSSMRSLYPRRRAGVSPPATSARPRRPPRCCGSAAPVRTPDQVLRLRGVKLREALGPMRATYHRQPDSPLNAPFLVALCRAVQLLADSQDWKFCATPVPG
jgi:hypothetical protein